MSFLNSIPWRTWVAVNAVGLALAVGLWHVRFPTHWAGQEYSRTVLALEVIPVLVGGITIQLIRQPVPWLVLTSARRWGPIYALLALLATAPAIALPLVVRMAIQTVPAGWLPGSNHLDSEMTTLADLLPWWFMCSLSLNVLVCVACGLVVEAVLGRGIGGIATAMALGGLVLLQSWGWLQGLAGAPGLDVHPSWATWLAALLAHAVSIVAFGWARAGARAVLTPKP